MPCKCIPWSCILVQANTKNCDFQILETAFKKETVGLVTREQYVEKVIDRPFMYISLSLSIPGQSKFWLLNFHPLPEQRVNIRTKIEEEEKEKLQKLQQE